MRHLPLIQAISIVTDHPAFALPVTDLDSEITRAEFDAARIATDSRLRSCQGQDWHDRITAQARILA